MLPETLCLADLGLGHDERAKHPQPVRERMGTRFYDWQLEQSPEESWAECEQHARNILGDEAFERMMAETEGGDNYEPTDQVAEPKTEYGRSGHSACLTDPKGFVNDPVYRIKITLSTITRAARRNPISKVNTERGK